jgi:FtsP/CotA-like multicopper oxidase with cupredoxin domain
MYHPHYQKTAGKQMNLGLGGLFLVEDSEETALNLPTGENRETTIVIQDKRFNEDNMMFYGPNPGEQMAGYFGETSFSKWCSRAIQKYIYTHTQIAYCKCQHCENL